jgi:hypothetical protein
MKNMFFIFLFVIFCNEIFAKDLSLDSAISVMAAEIMKKDSKIGKWKKIVLTDFSDSIEVQNYIEEELTNKLINNFTIIDRKNLGILREELEFQNTGEVVDPASIKKIGSVYGADFVLWGSLKNRELTIKAENVQKGTTDFSKSLSVEKNDIVLKNLEKNTQSICLPLLCGRGLPNMDEAVKIAISHLSKKVLESKENKILVYNIWADKSELSESISKKIEQILSDDKNVDLITNRAKLGKIETEMSFQVSGEVDANTIKERGKLFGANAIIYGNIRPIDNDYRLFLYAVNVENAKIIATHSQKIKGDEDIKNFALPSKINVIEVKALSSDKIIISWENISNARNFIVYRINPNNPNNIEQIRTGANGTIDLKLKAETEYCYSVQSRNTVGTGEKSEQRCATTYGTPKFGYNKPKIKDKTENNVVVMWNKIPGASYYNVSRCLKNKCNYSAKNLRDTIYKDLSGLQNSTIYEYFIEAVNSAGVDASDRIGVITKPIPPINIIAIEIFADKLKLKWEDKQENISHYIIEGYSDNINNKIVEITKLKPETTYQFRLKSVNTAKDESEFSKPLEIKTSGKPNAPDSVRIRIDSAYYYGKTITINWYSVSGVDDYVVYRDGKQLKSTRDTLYQVDDYSRLEKGTEYTYSISARNAAGESEKRAVSILTEPPEPIITKKDIGDNRFSIEWNPVPSTYKYLIKYEISDKNSSSKNGDTLVMDTFFKKENLPYSSTLTYCIIAVNKTGESGCSKNNTIKFKTLDAPQKPYALKVLAVSADSIMLRWNTVQNASGYVLYLCEDDRFGHKSYKLLYEGNDTNYVHIGLKANKEYEYAVATKNAAGESEKIHGKDKTYILPPTNIKTEELGLDSVKITWQKTDGASYYKTYRKEGNGDSSMIGNTYETEWIDKKIEAKKEYSYYIAAVSENGKESTSEAKKHKTAAAGTLILKNENIDGYVITGYEIKNGSKTMKKDSLNISRDGKDRVIFFADGKSYDLYITTNNPAKGQIKVENKVQIKEGEEKIFIYKGNRLVAR